MEAVNTKFKVGLIGLTWSGIKPESIAPEANALTTLPSELLNPIKISSSRTLQLLTSESLLIVVEIKFYLLESREINHFNCGRSSWATVDVKIVSNVKTTLNC